MRCVALLSGGLDASLAVRLVQRQGIDVHALAVASPLDPQLPAAASAAAEQLGVPLTIATPDADYAPRLAAPRLGRLGQAAACLDCRLAWLKAAKAQMESLDAAFVVTGDVLGQRPRTSAFDLELVAAHAGLEGWVVRPLSARRLPPTVPEERGWLHRQALSDIVGKSRRIQRQLAGELQVTLVPPRPDCPLLAGPLAQRLTEAWRRGLPVEDWLLPVLRKSRQVPLAGGGYLLLGRNASESRLLLAAYAEYRQRGAATLTSMPWTVWLLEPIGLVGPVGLVLLRKDSEHGAALAEAMTRLQCRLRRASADGCVRLTGPHGAHRLPWPTPSPLTAAHIDEVLKCVIERSICSMPAFGG